MSDDSNVKSNVGCSHEIDFDSLNFDLEELDDVEYQIPPVVEPPSLESILNDGQERSSLNDDSESINWIHGVGEQGSVVEGGSETISLTSQRSKNFNDKRGGTSTAFLRHVLLKGISTQLTSATDRVDAGTASVVTVTSMVAVGTTHGFILVFDGSQTLKWCLNTTDCEQGSVSSLCFNNDCTRLLAGFARGHILMFDLTNGKQIRSLTDAHPPGTSVLNVKFTDLPNLALCSDSGGSVFELGFKRTLGVRGCDSKCLFSGSRGEVCTIQPLLLSHLTSHPLQGVVLVAMATLSKVIVVSIRPRMRVVLVRALPLGSTLLPFVTWQFVVIQVGSTGKVIDPVLAYAKDNAINFFQVSVDGDSKLRVAPLQKLILSYSLLSLHWLNSWTVAAVDVKERLHLLDVHSHEELENMDLSGIGMVYETSHFKGLSTGGNVSKAMAVSGEKACYNSVVSYGNQLLVLGKKSLHVVSIRPWTERLNFLVKQKKYLSALSLGLSFYEEPKAVVGMKGSKERRQEMAKGQVAHILEQFIEDMTNPSEDIPACMQYALAVKYQDLIFNKLWENVFMDASCKSIFLESLEPLILNEQLHSIPPAVLQQFVNHYDHTGKIQALEACITHLDISTLDIHQVVQVCWSHGLYDGIIHINNKALNDYITPFHDLVVILEAALSSGRELNGQEVELGNKLLVYVSSCLAGRGYPYGEVPRDMIQKVKYEMFNCLISLHSKDASDNELPYPYLRTLIHFDTRELLNVISLAFTEPEFTSELGLLQRQRLVDILLKIMVHTPGFSPSEVGALFTFLARQLGRPNSGLNVDKELFHKVFEFLTEPNGHHNEERQQALLELLRAGGLQDYSKQTLLALAKKANFLRVCEVIHEQSNEWDHVLVCYLDDPVRRQQVIPFLRNIFVLYKNTKDIDKLLNKICERIQTIIEIDESSIGLIVTDYMLDKLHIILDNLADNHVLQLSLLKSIIFHRCKDTDNVKDLLPKEIMNLYLSLVTRHEPDNAVSMLDSYRDMFDIDVLLETSIDCQHILVQSNLLERKGEFKTAFQVLNTRLKTLLNTNSESEDNVEKIVVECVNIVQRCVKMFGEDLIFSLWTSLLETLISCKKNGKTKLLKVVLSGTVGHTRQADILQFVLKHSAYNDATFGDIRLLIISMLENCRYEVEQMEATNRLVSYDLHYKLSDLLTTARRGVRPHSNNCCVCQYSLYNSVIVLFPCGHPAHDTCTHEYKQCSVCSVIALDQIKNHHNNKRIHSEVSKTIQFSLKTSAPPIPNLDNLL